MASIHVCVLVAIHENAEKLLPIKLVPHYFLIPYSWQAFL